MIAVALVVIIGVVAVTCGIVADSNHADTLTFLGVMVKTTAAQIFLAGAICTWALFASMWLLSAGIRRSRERGLELRLLKALRARGFPGAPRPAVGRAAMMAGVAGLVAGSGASVASDVSGIAGITGAAGITDEASDGVMSASIPSDSSVVLAGSAEAADAADSEPTVDFSDFADFGSLRALDHGHGVAESGIGRRVESGRFYRATSQPDSDETFR